MLYPIDSTYLIEVPLKANQLVYTLNKIERLRDRPIRGIVVYKSGKSTTGADIADPSDAYFRFKERLSNDYRRDLLPVRSLIYDPQYPVLQGVEFDARPIEWTESQIIFPQGSAPTDDEVFQMLVIYDWEKMSP